jgi:protein involved in polysaccharide export with SLBB domain
MQRVMPQRFVGGTGRMVLVSGLALSLVTSLGCRAEATPLSVPGGHDMDTALGVGDVIEVRVYGEPDLTARHSVAEDGSIDFPLIGRVVVAQKKPPEVADMLEQRLREGGYLRTPHVSIFVEEYRSKRVTVLGAVSNPGSYPFTPGLTVMQAVSLAGGFTALGNRNSTTITRRSEGELVRIQVPAGNIQKGAADDFRLQPGDMIFVPERVF